MRQIVADAEDDIVRDTAGLGFAGNPYIGNREDHCESNPLHRTGQR